MLNDVVEKYFTLVSNGLKTLNNKMLSAKKSIRHWLDGISGVVIQNT